MSSGDTIRFMQNAGNKLGLLGGSFNPVHLAHLVMAEQAAEALGLERVLFVPSRLPPHKHPAELANAEDRLAMVRLAVEGNPRFEASDVELRREGTTYSIDTVTALREQFPGAEVFFLIGLDTVGDLPTWKEIRRLASLCRFVPLGRPGVAEPALESLAGAIGEAEARAVLARRLPMPLLEISSTDIRRRVCEGRSIRYLVPRAVEEYIHSHSLYRQPTAPASSRPRRCCGGA